MKVGLAEAFISITPEWPSGLQIPRDCKPLAATQITSLRVCQAGPSWSPGFQLSCKLLGGPLAVRLIESSTPTSLYPTTPSASFAAVTPTELPLFVHFVWSLPLGQQLPGDRDHACLVGHHAPEVSTDDPLL